MLKFTTFNNVETTFYISTLNWTTLTSKQRCHLKRRFTQRWTTSKQRCEYDHLEKKNKSWFKNKIIFLSFKEYGRLKSLHFFPTLRGICKRIFAGPQKFWKHQIYWITKSIFKPSHFVKCQFVFNLKRQVQAHYDYHSVNFICVLNVLENHNATFKE